MGIRSRGLGYKLEELGSSYRISHILLKGEIDYMYVRVGSDLLAGTVG